MPRKSHAAAEATPKASASGGAASPTREKHYWLLKSEPDPHVLSGVDVSYPFERFATEPDRIGVFNGVRNLQARGNLRDRLYPGDECFFYHSSCKVPGIAGVVEVVSRGTPDPDALNPAHPFYDESHTDDKPKWYCIRLRAVRPLRRFISLTELRTHADDLANMTLLRQPRLSVQPVSPEHWKYILDLESREGPPAEAASGKRRPAAPPAEESTESAAPTGAPSAASSGSRKRARA